MTSEAPFRALGETGQTVAVTLDGAEHRVRADQSLLAVLLCGDSAPAFTCAIGQCQRCLVRVNGTPRLACTTYAAAGERIEILRSSTGKETS